MSGATGGSRAGSRRGPRRRSTFQPALLGIALGITACVVAWGYLVVAAIDFGSRARAGQANAWGFLGVASAGAVACLFVAMMLVARLLRRLGITRAPEPPPARTPRPAEPPRTEPAGSAETGETGERPRPVGGRRAAR